MPWLHSQSFTSKLEVCCLCKREAVIWEVVQACVAHWCVLCCCYSLDTKDQSSLSGCWWIHQQLCSLGACNVMVVLIILSHPATAHVNCICFGEGAMYIALFLYLLSFLWGLQRAMALVRVDTGWYDSLCGKVTEAVYQYWWKLYITDLLQMVKSNI